jgi:hypothetical protein
MNASVTAGTGSGWPDPTEPGVPAASLQDGYHWLGEQGVTTRSVQNRTLSRKK